MAKIKKTVKTKAKIVLKNYRKPPVSVAVLASGRDSDFWALICATIDANIEELEDDLKGDGFHDLNPAEYKIRTEVLKAKLKHLALLKETPDNLIKSVSEETQPEENHDPYS